MWARTLCPLSSSTRNCVLGNASVTVPSTSMTSSLAKDLPCSHTLQNDRSQTCMLPRALHISHSRTAETLHWCRHMEPREYHELSARNTRLGHAQKPRLYLSCLSRL